MARSYIWCKSNRSLWKVHYKNSLPVPYSSVKRGDDLVKKKTNKEFIEEVGQIVGDEYIFLEAYVNAKTKIKCRHNVCGYTWDIIPYDLIKGNKCPVCSKKNGVKKRTKSNEVFIKEVYDLVGDEYIFLEKYVTANTKILCKHNICGHEWAIRPSCFLSGQKCPNCSRLKTDEEFKKEVYNLTRDEYTFLNTYKGANIKISCKHNLCNHVWDVPPSSFLRGTRCPKCAMQRIGVLNTKTTEMFVREVYELVGNEYTVIDEYKHCFTKINIRHNKCGNPYFVDPNNFLNGSRCPQCNESKGEQAIRKYLEDQNIKFNQEHSFENLVGVNEGLLRFDFAIFDNQNKLKLLIEYDGEFHFRKAYEEQKFEELQIHDERKNQYCKDNNIPLLRIPYWEFENIEDILFEVLNKL